MKRSGIICTLRRQMTYRAMTELFIFLSSSLSTHSQRTTCSTSATENTELQHSSGLHGDSSIHEVGTADFRNATVSKEDCMKSWPLCRRNLREATCFRSNHWFHHPPTPLCFSSLFVSLLGEQLTILEILADADRAPTSIATATLVAACVRARSSG